ncbi:hypothetical protein [Ferdinandcohnia sp. Marseille-Q9671]
MEQIKLKQWLVEIDVTKTKEFYKTEFELCDCLYCKNYYEVSRHLTPPLLEIFKKLGITPSKPIHVDEFGEITSDLRLYIGSYHIVGKLLEGEYCSDSEWSDTNTATVGNYTFGFTRDITFVHEEFPTPVLQIDFEARVPWVLTEKPED